MINIFYSWQNDVNPKTNRYFIQYAIKRSIKNIKLDDKFSLKFRIDEGASGEPGLPNIVETIFNRIESSQIFIADITYGNTISIGEKDKGYPNPNVMIELGYYAGKKTGRAL